MNRFIVKSGKASAILVSLILISCGSSSRQRAKFGEDFPWIWTVGLNPTERAAFEAESKRGAVLVRYKKPETIEILPGCGEAGAYELIESTRSTQLEPVQSEHDIYSKFPLNAGKLAGKYSKGRSWALEYMIIGISTVKISQDDLENLEDNCDRATHYVKSMAIGAFDLRPAGEEPETTSRSDGGMGEEVEPKRGVLAAAGDFSACASGETLAGDPACNAVIRLYLEPL